jgi:hypothetical protein
MVVGRQGTVGAFPYPRAEGGPVARLPPTARYASAPTHRHQCTDAIGNAGRAPTRARHPPAPARPHAGLLAADPAIMDPPASTSRLGTEFDDFLFAPLGEDRNGVPLSIVSLLGRMDLDPWREADSLAGLPAEAAVHRLASLLAALPVSYLKEADPGKLAARLIALLPRRSDPRAGSPARPANVSPATRARVVISAIAFALYLIWSLGRFEGTREDPSAHKDTAHAPASVAAPSQTPSRIE